LFVNMADLKLMNCKSCPVASPGPCLISTILKAQVPPTRSKSFSDLTKKRKVSDPVWSPTPSLRVDMKKKEQFGVHEVV